MKVPFVHSGYERKENDDYQTIDPRCVQALVETGEMNFPKPYGGYRCVDICGSHGSGIVTQLLEHGYDAFGLTNALVPLTKESLDIVVTNPPYARGIVDDIAGHVIREMQKQNGPDEAYFLMRANWDCAIGRAWMFDNPLYRGQLRMRFRPWWSEERKAQPIHNYVWHRWSRNMVDAPPSVSYWPRVKT